MIAVAKGKTYFNIIGAVIVVFWLSMVGILIKRTNSVEFTSGEAMQGGPLAIESTKRDWKDIYLNNKKVGYSVSLIRPFEDGYYVQDEIFLKLNLMGLGRGLYSVTQSNVDRQFVLRDFFFKMNSGVVSTVISGKVDGNQITIKTGRGRRQKSQTIQLSEPPMISSGIEHIFKTRKIRVGESFRLPFFDPSTMAQNDISIKVMDRENLRINRIDYNAFRLETEMWGKTITFWIDEEGSVLKEEGMMGLMMVKSSAANAPLNIDGTGGEDFYELTAVQVDKQLPKPSKLSYLRLRVLGVEEVDDIKKNWDNGRQNYSDGIIEIRREKEPFKAAYSMPYDDQDGKFSSFLKPEFNIESDSEEIIEKAGEITKDTDNPVVASGKLLRWVYENIDKKPVVSIPSALEVLRTRVGDCNEHATLLTALLRASGIPARMSVGLVYSRNKFFYHAWTEAYVGEWVSMDATLDQMPADVSHIRLMHGNLDKQVEIMGVIGKIKFEVLDFGYD